MTTVGRVASAAIFPEYPAGLFSIAGGRMIWHALTLAAALAASSEGAADTAPASPSTDVKVWNYTCNTTADHFDQQFKNISGKELSISGMVSAVTLHKEGKYSPTVAARISSLDDKNQVELRIGFGVAKSTTYADIYIATVMDGKRDYDEVGHIDTTRPIPFQIKLSESGKAVLTVGGAEFNRRFKALSTAKAVLFCNSGRFDFSGQGDLSSANSF